MPRCMHGYAAIRHGKSPRARAAPWRLRARGRCSRPPHLSLSTAMAAKSSPTPPGSVRAPRCAGRWPSRADHRGIDTERDAGRHCPCRFMGHGERHADSVHGSDRNAAPNHGNYVKREDVTPVDRGSIVVVRMRRVLRLLRSDGSFLGMHVGNACLGFIASLLQQSFLLFRSRFGCSGLVHVAVLVDCP